MYYPGDRVRYVTELASFGTVLSEPHDGVVSVRLDDGRALQVPVHDVVHVDAEHAIRRLAARAVVNPTDPDGD